MTTTAHGIASRRRRRNRSTSAEAASTQCRSSTTTTVGSDRSTAYVISQTSDSGDGAVERAQVGEQVADRAQGARGAERVAPAAQHPQAVAGRAGCLDERGLAGPGLAADGDTGPGARRRGVESPREHVELALPLEEAHGATVGRGGRALQTPRPLRVTGPGGHGPADGGGHATGTGSALCGPNSFATTDTTSAGNPPRRACSRIVSTSSVSCRQ